MRVFAAFLLLALAACGGNGTDDGGSDDADHDGVLADVDCDDNDDSVGEAPFWFEDGDADGFGEASSTIAACAQPSGYTDQAGDCDDEREAVNPDETEVWYDGIDADCGGTNDYDRDGDGYVHVDHPDRAGGTAPEVGDCDDTNAAVFPGATETCDDVDDDCDDSVVEAFADTDGDLTPDCVDTDDDNDGDLDATDCAPLDDTIFTGATEACDAIDSDCDDSLVDEFTDFDADGMPDCADSDDDEDGDPDTTDCAPFDDAIHTGATETWYDGIDQNCDGANDYDQDGDTYVAEGHADQAGGTALYAGDCADQDGGVNPGAAEQCDGDDWNCDGRDGTGNFDGDAFLDCEDDDDDDDNDPDATDCDDYDATVFTGAVETWYDGIDQNCDGANDYDQDGDSYVEESHDAEAGGTAPDTGDCVDDDPDIHPHATDIPNDGTDQDCTGFDATPASFAGIQGLTVIRDTAVGAIWSAAIDDTTATGEMLYDLYLATTSGAQDFTVPTATSAPGATSHAVSGLVPDTQYFVVVRSRDEHGDHDTNEIELAARTPTLVATWIRDCYQDCPIAVDAQICMFFSSIDMVLALDAESTHDLQGTFAADLWNYGPDDNAVTMDSHTMTHDWSAHDTTVADWSSDGTRLTFDAHEGRSCVVNCNAGSGGCGLACFLGTCDSGFWNDISKDAGGLAGGKIEQFDFVDLDYDIWSDGEAEPTIFFVIYDPDNGDQHYCHGPQCFFDCGGIEVTANGSCILP